MSVEENFIPFSMIEPLLEEGMMGGDLRAVILDRLGLPSEGYALIIKGGLFDPSLAVALRRGIHVLPKGHVGERYATTSRHEPVR